MKNLAEGLIDLTKEGYSVTFRRGKSGIFKVQIEKDRICATLSIEDEKFKHVDLKHEELIDITINQIINKYFK